MIEFIVKGALVLVLFDFLYVISARLRYIATRINQINESLKEKKK